jgi:RimJ/RimL family protein N-acetyltransferase
MIYGEKVRLRPVERADLPRYVEWFADPEVRDGLSMHLGFSLAQEEQWFESALKREPNEQPFALDAKTPDGWTLIGNMGFHEIDWRNRHAEFGIVIGDKNFWGQGYGTDAVKTLAHFGFAELNLERIWLRVFDNNSRAIRCYEKAGFKLEGRLRRSRYHDGQYDDTLIMALLRDEWEASKV